MQYPPLKRVLFGILAMLLPLLVLALAEILLRASGVVAERQELFRPVPQDERYMVVNPRFAGRYFTGFEPDVAPQPFLRRKPEGTLRLFVLGGSSAAGFPYNFYNGFPARLEEKLQQEHPGRPVEVVNLGMTAVNSFTLRDIHHKLLRYDPDGILIYAGHNEYYGAFGAASVPGWMRPLAVRRLVLKLERLHLVAAARRVVARDAGRASGNGRTGDAPRTGEALRTGEAGRAGDGHRVRPQLPEDRTLMARMAEDRLVHRGDNQYRDGIRHFEKNMEDVLATFRRHDIPVILATVVSNKKGQTPLADDPVAMDLYDRAIAAAREHEMRLPDDLPPASTRDLPEDVIGILPDSAMALFREAKERDPLRFRAPEVINEAIRRLADTPGVTLVDAHGIRTPEGALLPFAPDYFTDHLHPDHRGYTLIARAFHEALTGKKTTGPQHGRDFPPTDPLETVIVEHTLAVLKSDFPFERDPQQRRPGAVHRERLADYGTSGNPVQLAARDYFAGSRPLAASLAALAGTSRDDGRHRDALLYLRSLRYLQPINPELDTMIRDYLEELSRLDGYISPADILPLLVRLTAPEFDRRTWPAAVELLMDDGLYGDADLWLQAWQQHDSEPPAEYYRLRAMWHIGMDDYQGAQHWFREYYRRIR
jgi:hypothetical protein